jgi:hypothetical protein
MRAKTHRPKPRTRSPAKDHEHSLLHKILQKVNHMSAELDTLVTEVEETRTVIDSAIALIQGIKAQLDAAGTDRAKLKELSDSLDSKEKELAEAVAANTPTP